MNPLIPEFPLMTSVPQISISYYISVDDLIHLHLFFYNDKDRWPDVIGIGTH